jgi:hypothetical protein
MTATLSTRQIRLVGLLVLVVVLGGGFMVATRHRSTTTPSTASSTPAVTTPARTTHATTTPAPSKGRTTTPAVLHTHGLPVPVARALQKHEVVVVTLTTPRGADDQLLRAEAQAGATEAGVGYVSINVFHQRPGTAVLRKLGVTDTPVTLVIKRPANIFNQFPGFVDRDVIAQAATDAR